MLVRYVFLRASGLAPENCILLQEQQSGIREANDWAIQGRSTREVPISPPCGAGLFARRGRCASNSSAMACRSVLVEVLVTFIAIAANTSSPARGDYQRFIAAVSSTKP